MDAHIEITKQDAVLEITTYRAKVDITTQRPQLRLHRNAAQMSIDRQLPTMHLYHAKVNPSLGISHIAKAARDYYLSAVQASLSGKPIDASTSGIDLNYGDQTYSVSSNSRSGDLTALQAAEIRWDPGYMNINWTPGTLEAEWDVSTWADIRVEPSYVEIRMAQYPGIKINVVYDQKKHKYNGKFVDKYV
jgi:hypothetical protein